METITYLFDRVWWKPWTWFPTGAVVQREPEWSLTDVDWSIAAQQFDASIGSHGHPLDEATSADADPTNPKGKYRYEAGPKPRIDYAERARAQAAEAYRKTLREDESMAGKFFPVRKVPR